MNIIFKIENKKNKNIDISKLLINDLEIRLQENDTYYLFRKEMSCVYFEVEHKKNEYNINVFKLSTSNDWKLVLAFMSNLSALLQSDITVKDTNEKYNFSTIAEFNYSKIIIDTLKNIVGDIKIKYIIRNVFLSTELIEKILNEDDPIDYFDRLIFRIQYAAIENAPLEYYTTEKNINVGIYYLDVDNKHIINFNPYIDDTIHHYYINLIDNLS
ncbi:MAG: DUF4299 family protein [Oceanivirga sp.]|nr:DUF4299 family protein [Oceanivirga sp.]